MDVEARQVGHWRYAALFLPYGLASGFVVVTLAYMLAQAKAPTVAIGALAALQLAPQTWKFLYTPVIDCVWNYRRWYIGGAIVTGLLIAASGLLPMSVASLPALSLFTLLASVASSACGAITGGLIAHAAPDGRKGRASAGRRPAISAARGSAAGRRRLAGERGHGGAGHRRRGRHRLGVRPLVDRLCS
jgi:MFS family permease